MEGPSLRSFPRTFFCCPVELSVGDKIIRREQAQGNLSIHGLFLQAEVLPVDSAVHIKIGAARSVEVDGVVRFCGGGGVGIQFTAPLKADRECVADLIADFTERETLPH
jgi:PilZ domain